MSEAFKTTRWSLIVAAAGDDAIANEALSELCQVYWRPLYAYVDVTAIRPRSPRISRRHFSCTFSSIEASSERIRRADTFVPTS